MSLQIKTGNYTGNGTSQSITGVGFQPSVLFIKGNGRVMQVGTVDMGGNMMLNINGGSTATGRLTSLDSDGFTVSSNTNVNTGGESYYYLALYDDDNSEMSHGTYPGTSNVKTIVTGFQPDLIMSWDNIGDTGAYRTSDMPTDSMMPYGGAPGLITGRITSIVSNGYTVTSRNEVNGGSPRVYYWVAFKKSSIFTTFTYTGNATDNRNITGLGFQPDFTLVNNAAGLAATVRFKQEIGDASFLVTANVETTDLIQGFASDGIQVGTTSNVNGGGNALYNVAFKESSAAPPATTGQIKVWDNTAFVAKPGKVWDGSAWVTKPVKYWDGSAWTETSY